MKSHKDLVLEVQFCEINAVNFENKNILNAFLRMMDKCLQKSQQSLKHAGGAWGGLGPCGEELLTSGMILDQIWNGVEDIIHNDKWIETIRQWGSHI